jgi:hypothetical protein
MSTLYPVIEIEYKNRKPSKTVVMRTIAEYLKQGAKAFSITWGENWIDLNYHDGYRHWYGTGHIKDISGQDIGEELNSIRKQALNDIKTLNLWNT